MSGAEAALRAARLGDEVVHGFGLMGMVAGALIGAAIAVAIIVAGVATGGLAIVAIVAGCIAGGGLAGGALARGIMKAADLPGPTTGTLAAAGPSRVTVNSRMALRAGVDFAPGCSGAPMNHFAKPGPVLIAEGSRTVTINGMPMARQSMKLVCGAKIKSGSCNVTVGGPTARVVEVQDNEESFEKGLQIVGMIALGAAGLGAVAAGLGASLMFVGVVVASNYGMKALHDWGESLGPGYGDIMVGAAGFALLGIGPRLARTSAGRGAIDVLNRTEVRVSPNRLGSNLGGVEIGLKGIPKSTYDKLRGMTPTSALKKMVNRDYVEGMADKALPGLKVSKPLHADHIVSMKEITRMKGFDKLTFENQLKVLNNKGNFVGLSETANTSKGSKSFVEWTKYKKGDITVDANFRKEMIALESMSRSMLENQIRGLLEAQGK
ncbi:MAG TPA: hypothetical protein DCY59_14090 [Micrococcaceae bacterium]|nr:hypothetical protein [Micrococcaceae bacterium]